MLRYHTWSYILHPNKYNVYTICESRIVSISFQAYSKIRIQIHAFIPRNDIYTITWIKFDDSMCSLVKFMFGGLVHACNKPPTFSRQTSWYLFYMPTHIQHERARLWRTLQLLPKNNTIYRMYLILTCFNFFGCICLCFERSGLN